MQFKRIYLKRKSKIPKKKRKKHKKCFFYEEIRMVAGMARGLDKLEQEIKLFINEHQNSYDEKRILWDGFCRLCSNEKDKGCTYDAGDPCRYPDKMRYSMEAVGIDVTQTVKNLNFNLEWPPNEFVYRFGLVCFK